MRSRAIFLLAALAWALPVAAQWTQKPKVRAVTAFVRLERGQHQEQIADALKTLRSARSALEQAGYEVQSVRIATQPFPEYARGLSRQQAIEFFRKLEALSKDEGFDLAIGPGMLNGDAADAELLAVILQSTTLLNASLAVADENGVNWAAVRAAARLIKSLEENTPGSIGNFNFAATAMLGPHAPFFPGAYNQGEGREFAIALQSANVVEEAFANAGGDVARGQRNLTESLGRHATAVEAVARDIEKQTGWRYMGIDLSPAPLKDVSIGGALERLTGAPFGSSGSMTAAAALTAALRAIPVRSTGYSGVMVPVLEDAVIARRWSEGVLGLDALLAYSAVCGTGLDTVPLPGDISEERLARIIGDMASLAFKLKKPLSARLMPVKGKRAGDRTEFNDPFLVNATIQELR